MNHIFKNTSDINHIFENKSDMNHIFKKLFCSGQLGL